VGAFQTPGGGPSGSIYAHTAGEQQFVSAGEIGDINDRILLWTSGRVHVGRGDVFNDDGAQIILEQNQDSDTVEVRGGGPTIVTMIRNLSILKDYLAAPIEWGATAGAASKGTDNYGMLSGIFTSQFGIGFMVAGTRSQPGIWVGSDPVLGGYTGDSGTGLRLWRISAYYMGWTTALGLLDGTVSLPAFTFLSDPTAGLTRLVDGSSQTVTALTNAGQRWGVHFDGGWRPGSTGAVDIGGSLNRIRTLYANTVDHANAGKVINLSNATADSDGAAFGQVARQSIAPSVSAGTTTSNSTAETALASPTITGAAAGDLYRITIRGALLNNSGAAVTYTPRVRLGASIAAAAVVTGDAVSIPASANTRQWVMTIELTEYTDTAHQDITLNWQVSNGSLNNAPNTGGTNIMGVLGGGQSTVDMTTNPGVWATMQMGTANASATFIVYKTTVERIR